MEPWGMKGEDRGSEDVVTRGAPVVFGWDAIFEHWVTHPSMLPGYRNHRRTLTRADCQGPLLLQFGQGGVLAPVPFPGAKVGDFYHP
jgi:hypothetical protein